MQFDDTQLLIEPGAAQRLRSYASCEARFFCPAVFANSRQCAGAVELLTSDVTKFDATAKRAKSFHGSADISPLAAKFRLVQIAEEVIALLTSNPNASVKVTVAISADFSDGATDQTKRAVSENAKLDIPFVLATAPSKHK